VAASDKEDVTLVVDGHVFDGMMLSAAEHSCWIRLAVACRKRSTPGSSEGAARGEVMNDLEKELAATLNRHSAENASNTPDFILAQYLLGCLAAWNTAVQQRETWYGRDSRLISVTELPSAPREDEEKTNDMSEENG